MLCQLSYGTAWRPTGDEPATSPGFRRRSHLMTHHRPVQDRRAVRVDRHALLRVERHARLATFRERDELAHAGAEVVVHHQRLGGLPRLARQAVAVLHLDDEEPAAHERVVERVEADATD